jgi:putative ABC transport system substrate-binding protein
MPGMRRREFVSLFGGAAASSPAWSRVAHAQQRTPTIGFLGVSTAASWTDWTAAFVSRLGELGWTDGRNVAIEYRWAGGLAERYPEIAAEFVRRKVDIIVTGGIAVPAAKQATSTIPIVFALAADPLAVWLQAWRGQEATSPAFRLSRAVQLPSESKFYARSFPACAGSR